VSIAAVLYDLDGTLLDTRDMILASFQYATRKVLQRKIPDAELLDLVGIPLGEQMQHLDAQHAQELVETYRTHNQRVHDELIRSFADTDETLAAIKVQGIPQVVVTSKRNELAWRGLGCFNLQGYFDFLIGSDDTLRHKPEPEPLLLAAARLGVPIERCVYLGDSPYDMRAACSAGAIAVAATWGIFTRDRLLAAGAQHELATISELPALLCSL
jgi:pyrophosphatase PpaX